MTTPPNNDVTAAQETLHNILVGYGCKDPEDLKDLFLVNNWKQRAQDELERRLTQLTNKLDIKTLSAIANGTVDISNAIDAAYKTYNTRS
jgi:hypothetical protein